MKGSSDDVHMSSAIPSPSEPSGMSGARSAQKLTTNDALSYLEVVKDKSKHRGGDMYNEFLDVMREFKSRRIDTSGVISKVKELFRGDPDLILGFNPFLPKGYEINLQTEDEPLLEKKSIEFEDAKRFVTKIKTRFQGDDHTYNSFLDILNTYRKKEMAITEVYQEVAILLQDHADLLTEFTNYLPDSIAAGSVHTQHGRDHILQQDCGGSPTITTPVEQSLDQLSDSGSPVGHSGEETERWKKKFSELEDKHGKQAVEMVQLIERNATLGAEIAVLKKSESAALDKAKVQQLRKPNGLDQVAVDVTLQCGGDISKYRGWFKENIFRLCCCSLLLNIFLLALLLIVVP